MIAVENTLRTSFRDWLASEDYQRRETVIQFAKDSCGGCCDAGIPMQ
jgi:hypothetical protein